MLKDKSTRNLAAGDALSTLGFTDAAASRYYYSLYQAAVHRLTQLGWTPGRLRSGAVRWDHVMVMHNMSLIRGRRSDRDLYEVMRDLRLKADYADVSVELQALADCVAGTREFVEEVTA